MLVPSNDPHSSDGLNSLSLPVRLMPQFRALFTGTFYAGKTTIAELLSDEVDVHVVREVARDLLASDPEFESHPGLQAKIIKEQTRRELAAEQSLKPLIILDRSYLDVICYSRYFGHPIDEPTLIKQFDYDKVLLFSPSDVNVSSSLSPEMQEYRMSIHRVFLKVLEELSIPYEVISGDVQERLLRIHNILNSARAAYATPSESCFSPGC